MKLTRLIFSRRFEVDKRRENINLVSFICLSFLVISFSKQLPERDYIKNTLNTWISFYISLREQDLPGYIWKYT